MKLLFAVAVLAVPPCLNGLCGRQAFPQFVIVPDAAAQVAAVRTGWHRQEIDRDSVSLFDANGAQVGAWRISEQKYYPLAGGSFGAAGESPQALPQWALKPLEAKPAADPPPKPAAKVPEPPPEKKPEPVGALPAGVPNFGIAVERMPGPTDEPQYLVGGRPVQRQQVFAAIAGDALGSAVPADGGKLRLVVIGTDAERAKVTADWDTAAELKPLHDLCTLHAYAPNDPMVRDLGYSPGTPAIYLQKPRKGQPNVLGRGEKYEGPAALAGEIRKRAENYDPKKDQLFGAPPSAAAGIIARLGKLAQSLLSNLSINVGEESALILLVAAAGLFLPLRRKEEK